MNSNWKKIFATVSTAAFISAAPVTVMAEKPDHTGKENNPSMEMQPVDMKTERFTESAEKRAETILDRLERIEDVNDQLKDRMEDYFDLESDDEDNNEETDDQEASGEEEAGETDEGTDSEDEEPTEESGDETTSEEEAPTEEAGDETTSEEEAPTEESGDETTSGVEQPTEESDSAVQTQNVETEEESTDVTPEEESGDETTSGEEVPEEESDEETDADTEEEEEVVTDEQEQAEEEELDQMDEGINSLSGKLGAQSNKLDAIEKQISTLNSWVDKKIGTDAELDFIQELEEELLEKREEVQVLEELLSTHQDEVKNKVAEEDKEEFEDQESTDEHKAWSVQFSSSMDQEKADALNFFVFDSNMELVSVEAVYDAESDVVDVIPDQPYIEGEQYTLVIAQSFDQQENVSLKNAVQMNFSIN